jgi:hypothetical protein
MGQYESWRMIRRILTPPAFPLIVRPFSADRSEHVAAEDEGAEALHCTLGEPVIKTRFTAVFSNHLTKSPRWEKPLKDFPASQTERMIQTLSGSRSKAVERDTESGNFYSGHQFLRRSGLAAGANQLGEPSFIGSSIPTAQCKHRGGGRRFDLQSNATLPNGMEQRGHGVWRMKTTNVAAAPKTISRVKAPRYTLPLE